MLYCMIVGIYKRENNIVYYDAIELNSSVEQLKAKHIKLYPNKVYNEKDIKIANASIKNGKIEKLTTSSKRYPQYDLDTKRVIETKYNSHYKVILIGRCLFYASGNKHEAIIYINGELKAVDYTKGLKLKEVLDKNNGCVSNGFIRDNGRLELQTRSLCQEEKEKGLYKYSRPVLLDLSVNRKKQAKVKEDIIQSQPIINIDSENQLANKSYRVENGKLLEWTSKDSVVVIPEDVKEIGEDVFKNNLYIQKLVLPKGLKKIGNNSFKGCINLKEVHNDCDSSLAEIGAHAFYGTRKLESFSYSPYTTKIGDYSFAGSGLRNLDCVMPNAYSKGKYYKAGLNGLENKEPSKKMTEIISGLEIGYGAFSNNHDLKSIEFIGDRPIIIKERAFEKCDLLETIKGDYRVKYIGDSAFEDTFELNKVNVTHLFSSDLEYVGNRAFHNSDIRGNITLHSKVRYIGESAFSASSISGVSIYIDTLDYISSSAFMFSSIKHLYIKREDKMGIKKFSIRNGCFMGCDQLYTVKVSSKVQLTNCQANIFADCPMLYKAELGATIKVYQGMFLSCTALTEINLEDIVEVEDMGFEGTNLYAVETKAKYIGNRAFAFSQLYSFNAPNVKKYGVDIFKGCTRLNLGEITFGELGDRDILSLKGE